MKNYLRAIACLSVLLGSAVASAQENLEFSGNLRFDKRFLVDQKNLPQYPIYHQAELALSAYPAEDVEAKLSTRLRYYDLTAVSQASGLNDTSQNAPLDFMIWEAYLDVFALGIDGLDLRIGKQRIAWGKADRLNPTDNLNPDDFTDYLNFGEKVPTWALKADLTIIEERLKLTAVFLPAAVPVSMPRFGSFPLSGAGGTPEFPAETTVTTNDPTLATNAYDMKHTMQAVKAAGNLYTVDWSLSYFHGYDDIPLLKAVDIVPAGAAAVTIDSKLKLPEINVIGADLAGELFSVGWWAEGAVFIPAKTVHTSVTAPDATGQPTTTEQVALSNDPYVKYTVGLDYTFSWGTYLNFQYNRGFFTERGSEQLHDYFMLRGEQKLLDGELKLAIGALWETDRFRDPGDNFGIGVFPEVLWKPRDNLEFVFGYFLIEGKGNSLFANLKQEDQVYIKAKAAF